MGKKINYHIKEDPPRRVSMTLAYNISYERQPSLFDSKEVTERDVSLRMSKIWMQDERGEGEFKKKDGTRVIVKFNDRANKPVALTPMGSRVAMALAYMVQDLDKCDIMAAIADINAPRPFRTLSLNELSRLIFDGHDKPYYRGIIAKEIMGMAVRWQVWHYILVKDGKKEERRRVVQLISADFDLDPSENGEWNVTIGFSPAFFYRINSNYISLSRHIFRIWGKKGNQNDLFATLLSKLLVFQVFARHAAAKTRKAKERQQSPADVIEEAVKEALCYRVLASTIKASVRTDYSSTRQYKAKFWADLKRAAGSLKDAGVITELLISKDKEAIFFFVTETEKKGLPETTGKSV